MDKHGVKGEDNRPSSSHRTFAEIWKRENTHRNLRLQKLKK